MRYRWLTIIQQGLFKCIRFRDSEELLFDVEVQIHCGPINPPLSVAKIANKNE